MIYKCKVEGCPYETDSRQGIAGHMAGHSKRGEWKAKSPVSQQQLPTPQEIANALLNAVVDAINRGQSLEEQIKVARSRIASLTEELTKVTGERDRILKLHNEQVKDVNKHGGKLPTTETLMRLARV